MSYNNETGLYEGYIYKIVNDINNKIYIGQTKQDIKKRFNQHIYTSTHNYSNMNISKAIYKYGKEHFKIEVIEKYVCKSKKELTDILNINEQNYIKYYKDKNIILYNIFDGGNAPIYISNEKPVIQYDLFCNYINEFPSITVASKATNTSHVDISACCKKNNRILSANNYIWRYKDDILSEKDIEIIKNKYKGCKQFDFNGNLLNIFYRPSDAVSYCLNHGIDISIDKISQCCSGKLRSAGGFIWRYCKDSFNTFPLPFIINYKKVEKHSIYNGELLQIYNNYIDASESMDIDSNALYQILSSKKSHYYQNYIWCYENEFKIDFLYKMLIKPVAQYDLDKNLIKIWDSPSQASKELNISKDGIYSACKNKIKTSNGYIWRYSFENIDTYVF